VFICYPDLFITFEFLAQGYGASSKTFIYSLYSINGYHPIKLSNLKGLEATVGITAYGPAFGLNGDDLLVSNNADSNQDSHSIPNSYQIPPGCARYTHCSFFTGTNTFTPNHVEVFYVKT